MTGQRATRLHHTWKTYFGVLMMFLLALGFAPAGRAFAAGGGVTTAVELNVRAGPGKNYAILDTLRQGSSVLIHSSNAAGDWINVSYTRGGAARSGWVSAKFVRPVTHQAPRQATLTVVNNTGATVYVLYVSPSTSSQWGSDVLGKDTTLSPGETFQMLLTPGAYDIMAKDYDLETIATAFDVQVSGNTTWYLD
jgi:uncharacterized protein YraI